MEDAVLVYEKAHPTLRLDTIFQERLRVLSANYTAAQLDTITIRTNPAIGPGHPALQAALKKEEALYGEYQQELSRAMKTNIELTDYTKLKADLDSKKQFVAALEDRIKQLRLNREAGHILNEIKVIEQARPAMRPSFPKPKRALAVAIVLGGLLGAGLALLRDRMDGRMRSVEEIQTVIGLPILGVVPGMTGRRTAVARAMTVHLDPRSVVAESYRTIRTAVYFGTTGTRCRTILVTSPESGDGKTTSASNLAIAIAQTGRSVLLLDADFRKPTQHKNLDIKNSIGLSSVLAGHDPLETAIQRTGVEGLDILPCGPIPANPSEILNSREFGELIDNLASRYDHILFDSPPVNAVTDARILGAVCDATILVLRADKSTRKAGEHARNALLAVGARVLGAIVNDAPNKKGYEVYGGSYYGSPEVAPRQSDRQGHTSTDFRRLPTPVSQNAR
jgi:capsular exopolysaccharide synthesis family protein